MAYFLGNLKAALESAPPSTPGLSIGRKPHTACRPVFSLSELDDAGINLDLAERMGLPVDAGRIGAYGPNVSAPPDFARSNRPPEKARSIQ